MITSVSCRGNCSYCEQVISFTCKICKQKKCPQILPKFLIENCRIILYLLLYKMYI